MLSAGGATVTPIGFRRTTKSIGVLENVGAIDLGRTSDGMLGRRIYSVVTAFARLGRLAQDVRGANVILARNLEMLVLAIRARERYAPGATVVYECLDIHRLLLSKALGGRLLRHIEIEALARSRSAADQFARVRAQLFHAARFLLANQARRKQGAARSASPNARRRCSGRRARHGASAGSE